MARLSLTQPSAHLADGEHVAVDLRPDGPKLLLEGARFPDYLEAWEASRRMARERRETRSEEAHHER